MLAHWSRKQSKRGISLFILLVALLWPAFLHAADYYVAENGTGDGSSPLTPAPNLSSLNALVDADPDVAVNIYIGPGDYTDTWQGFSTQRSGIIIQPWDSDPANWPRFNADVFTLVRDILITGIIFNANVNTLHGDVNPGTNITFDNVLVNGYLNSQPQFVLDKFLTIRNSTINGEIRILGGRYIRIENNTITNSGLGVLDNCIEMDWPNIDTVDIIGNSCSVQGGGIGMLVNARDMRISDNIIGYVTGTGLSITTSLRETIIERNQIMSTGSGVAMDMVINESSNIVTTNVEIRNNVLRGFYAFRIDVQNPFGLVPSLFMTNNTLAASDDVLIVTRSEGSLARPYEMIELHNNIMMTPFGKVVSLRVAPNQYIESNNNFLTADPLPFEIVTQQFDLPGYISFTGQGSNSFFGDPFIMDLASNDFELRSNSPCIDVGLDTVAPPEDVRGWIRDAQPDIGAFEFNATDPGPTPTPSPTPTPTETPTPSPTPTPTPSPTPTPTPSPTPSPSPSPSPDPSPTPDPDPSNKPDDPFGGGTSQNPSTGSNADRAGAHLKSGCQMSQAPVSGGGPIALLMLIGFTMVWRRRAW